MNTAVFLHGLDCVERGGTDSAPAAPCEGNVTGKDGWHAKDRWIRPARAGV